MNLNNFTFLSSRITRTAPITISVTCIGNRAPPNPKYLSILINKSVNIEYTVNDLWTIQKLNTFETDKISKDGNIAHPTIISATTKLATKIASVVLNHITMNIVIGIYFKHRNAILWCVLIILLLLQQSF